MVEGRQPVVGIVGGSGVYELDGLKGARWEKVLAINLWAVIAGVQAVVPAMRSSGGGAIVNMSSVSAMQGMSFCIAYGASKGAVRALTKSVAMYCKEQGNGVRCNSIHPDGVATPMVVKVATGKDTASQEEIDALASAANMCDPEDIANMVLYLVSDESRIVNGAEMVIDNAATITPPQII